ncbi:MAG: chitobiase/beta-hexosaminidase C-terminal domain-containing protein, partial [Ferruginibacter sp.]
YLSYFDIVKGGNINFMMGTIPSSFGAVDYPSTAITDNKIVLNPVIDGGAVSFKKDKTVKIYSYQPGVNIYYSLDGTRPNALSKKYTKTFTIDSTVTVKAIAINEKGELSYITTAGYFKMDNNWSVKLNTLSEPQYDGGGAEGLIDGIYGSANWRKGNWMGFQKTNMEAVIDLNETKTITKLTAGFLQDTRAWIVVPKQLIISVSADGINYTQVYSGENFLAIDDLNVQVKNVTASFTPVTAKYLKVKAVQYGKLPAWHEGAGGDTHIFIDEIKVK